MFNKKEECSGCGTIMESCDFEEDGLCWSCSQEEWRPDDSDLCRLFEKRIGVRLTKGAAMMRVY